jgi:hypothetical protein
MLRTRYSLPIAKITEREKETERERICLPLESLSLLEVVVMVVV